MIVTLYNGEQLESWLIAEEDGLVQLTIYYNGITLLFPTDLLPELAHEMTKVAEALRMREHRN